MGVVSLFLTKNSNRMGINLGTTPILTPNFIEYLNIFIIRNGPGLKDGPCSFLFV